jgi:hypothetical protein
MGIRSMVRFSYLSDDTARPDVRGTAPAVSLVGVPFPTVPDKHGYPSAYRPAAFLEALRAGGWEPGPVPESVVFTTCSARALAGSSWSTPLMGGWE